MYTCTFTFWHLKWSKAGLCIGPCSDQTVFHVCLNPCPTWPQDKNLYKVQAGWIIIRTQETARSNQVSWKANCRRLVCGWLCTFGTLWGWPSSHRKQVHWSHSPVWTHHQHKEDGSTASALACTEVTSSIYQYWWIRFEKCGPVQILGKYHVIRWDPQQRDWVKDQQGKPISGPSTISGDGQLKHQVVNQTQSLQSCGAH